MRGVVKGLGALYCVVCCEVDFHVREIYINSLFYLTTFCIIMYKS